MTILPVLALGGGRYLTVSGEVIAAVRTYTREEIEDQRALDPSFDPDLAAAPGDGYWIDDSNRDYWTRVAIEGGHDLATLLA